MIPTQDETFNDWANKIAWYDDEYDLWNLNDGQERLQYATDQFRFDSEEFYDYFLKYIKPKNN